MYSTLCKNNSYPYLKYTTDVSIFPHFQHFFSEVYNEFALKLNIYLQIKHLK